MQPIHHISQSAERKKPKNNTFIIEILLRFIIQLNTVLI